MSILPETPQSAPQRLAHFVAEAQMLPDENTISVVRNALIDSDSNRNIICQTRTAYAGRCWSDYAPTWGTKKPLGITQHRPESKVWRYADIAVTAY